MFSSAKTPNIAIQAQIQNIGTLPGPNNNLLLVGHSSATSDPPPADPGYPQIQFYVPLQLPGFTDGNSALAYMAALGFTIAYGISFNMTFNPGPNTITSGAGTSKILTWTSRPDNWEDITNNLTGTLTQTQVTPAPATVTGTFEGLGDTGYSIIVDNITGGAFQITTNISAAFVDNTTGLPNPDTTDEIALMVYKAVVATAANPITPVISIGLLKSSDTGFGPSGADVFFYADANSYQGIVIPYEIADSTDITTTYLRFFEYISDVNSPDEVENEHFGTFGIYGNVSTPATEANTLPADANSQFNVGMYYPYDNTVEVIVQSAAEIASAAAAIVIATGIPYNSLDGVAIVGVQPPTDLTTKVSTVGGTASVSDTVMNQGWTPITVNKDDQAAFVRTITSLVTLPNSGAPVTAYFDVQDWQIVFYNRQVKFDEFKAQFTNVKFSARIAGRMKAVAVGIDKQFEGLGMFQGVSQAAPFYQVQQDPTNRSRAIVYTPIDIIPNLHSVFILLGLTTQFDQVPVAL